MVIYVADGLWLRASCVDGKNQIIVIEGYLHFGTVSDLGRGDLSPRQGMVSSIQLTCTSLPARAVPCRIGARLCNCLARTLNVGRGRPMSRIV